MVIVINRNSSTTTATYTNAGGVTTTYTTSGSTSGTNIDGAPVTTTTNTNESGTNIGGTVVTTTTDGSGTTQQSTTISSIKFENSNLFSNYNSYNSSDNAYRMSPNGKYKLVFQSDGNLALYSIDNEKNPIWSSNTSSNPSAVLSFDSDGNLQIYSDSNKNKSLWSSGTGNNKGTPILVADDNGAAVLYQFTTNGWYATWSSIGLDKYNLGQTITVNYSSKSNSFESNDSVSPLTIFMITLSILFAIIICISIVLAYRKRKLLRMNSINTFANNPTNSIGTTTSVIALKPFDSKAFTSKTIDSNLFDSIGNIDNSSNYSKIM